MPLLKDSADLLPSLAQPDRSTTSAGLAEAILRTLTYSDLFDYPLTAAEITHYLIACPADEDAVLAALKRDLLPAGRAEQVGEYYALAGRSANIAVRRARSAAAVPLWRRARLWGRRLAAVPFVRMIAVTGALAMDNVSGKPDIDLLVVARPGRVWICRRLLVLAVRLARLRGDDLCPNYILAEDSLALAGQDLFTAHELAQMRPLTGYAVYRRMFAANGWLATHLPNAQPWPAPARAPRPSRMAERLLAVHPLNGWEAWEMARLQAKLGAPPTGDEVACTPQQCKGHTGYYRRRFLQQYEERLAGMEIIG